MRPFKHFWNHLLDPPWKRNFSELGLGESQRRARVFFDWLLWAIFWSWAGAGMLLGAILSPAVVANLGITDSEFRDIFTIGTALVTGVAVQTVGLALLYLSGLAIGPMERASAKQTTPDRRTALLMLGTVVSVLLVLLSPLAASIYGIYLFVSLTPPDKSTAILAFVGGLLFKTFVIPFIKYLFTVVGLKYFLKWVRSGSHTS